MNRTHLPRAREASAGTHKGRWQRRAEQKADCRRARRQIARVVRRTQEDPP